MSKTQSQSQPLFRVLTACLCVAFLSIAVAPAQAGNLDDVQVLMFKNDLSGALTRLDQHLSTSPKDRDARFLKGILLTEMRRLPEAIEVFTALTRDEPKLPEPYNNLAVIYAAQGQFDKAREALELAIKTHPSYSVAHENLGDLYAKLASMAYDKALELDRANTATKTKLALIRDLFSIPPQVPAEAAPEATPEAAPEAAPEATSTTPIVTPAAESAHTPVKTARTPAKTAATTPKAEAESALRAWAAAWSRQDVAAYLAHYSDDFKPATGVSLEQWKADRDTRIKAPKSILVKLLKLNIKVAGDTATATFKQHYKSDRLNEWMRKTLQLRREGDAWRIVDER